ncbi:ribose 5-phosphate isomerase A [Halopenitus persicus]|uniref:Ribose-5-phosphate isomerase A n=1 Tax=Halopenitus persicus TaxID=1048396 RepID=A0A1H3FX53_9EURY|nr:ribose 5-phosphate isomerase A [Halopenitus persicus]SDX95662.1 ribose-5-phosphate isomerase [Halopenitus persicus]
MKTTGGTDAQKRRAGESAAAAVEDGDVVGLGTGSTAAYAIRAIGRAVDSGLDVRGVPTSFGARALARDHGVPIVELDAVCGPDSPGIDLAIDGADQVVLGDDSNDGTIDGSATDGSATGEAETDGAGNASGALIKGGGAAHAREKVVDAAADRFLVVVDPSKRTDALDADVPVEVLPEARTTAAAAIRDAGGEPALRRAERKDGPVVTDNGNLVLDCSFGRIADPDQLAETLATVPGVLEHGIFVDLADEIHVGTADGVTVRSV